MATNSLAYAVPNLLADGNNPHWRLDYTLVDIGLPLGTGANPATDGKLLPISAELLNFNSTATPIGRPATGWRNHEHGDHKELPLRTIRNWYTEFLAGARGGGPPEAPIVIGPPSLR